MRCSYTGSETDKTFPGQRKLSPRGCRWGENWRARMKMVLHLGNIHLVGPTVISLTLLSQQKQNSGTPREWLAILLHRSSLFISCKLSGFRHFLHRINTLFSRITFLNCRQSDSFLEAVRDYRALSRIYVFPARVTNVKGNFVSWQRWDCWL